MIIVVRIHQGLVLQPTLYKFIVLGSLGHYTIGLDHKSRPCTLFYVSLILFYFLSIFPSSFFLFFPLFFSFTHIPLIFFSLFPYFIFFPTTSSTHVPLLFFLFFSFFCLFFYHFTLQNVPLLCIFFFLIVRKLQGSRKRADDDDDEDEDDWNIRKSLISLLNSQIP